MAMAAKLVSVWGALASVARAGQCEWPQICPGTFPPKWKQTYQMNKSTIIMPCNRTGLTDPATVAKWGIIDFDWSNSAGFYEADGWAKHKPMDDDELLFRQARMTKQALPDSQVWVYRNSIYGYPWFSSVRKILDDPAYRDWFMPFKPEGPWYSPKCDHNHDPPLCSDLYHSQYLTPLPEADPKGWGNCADKACDCGKHPCGFYVFNHSSTTVVGNQTFQQWFIHSYVLNEIGSSEFVNGFFWDDVWNEECKLNDQVPNTCEDMGLTSADLAQITKDYNKNMGALRDATLAAGKFSWQMLWTSGDATSIASTVPGPLVKRASCIADLRALCRADSPPQTRAMMYAFGGSPEGLEGYLQDLAGFLLVRGPYAWLGHGWTDCNRSYMYPPELDADYGEPMGICRENAPGSGVFMREWTKASVQLDCYAWVQWIQFKPQPPVEEEAAAAPPPAAIAV